MKYLLLLFSLLFLSPPDLNAQSCNCITGGRFRKQRMDSWTGLTSSKDYYTLVAQKVIHDSSATPAYNIFLNAASRVTLTDSMLHTPGRFELLLADGATIALDNVTYSNNPMGECCSLGFRVYITESQMKALSLNPIAALAVTGIFTTVFPRKSLERQKCIFSCLINVR